MSCRKKYQISNIKYQISIPLFFLLVALFLLYPNPYTLTPVHADWTFNADLPNCGIDSSYYYTPGSTYTITASSTDNLSSLILDISPISAQSTCQTSGPPPLSLPLTDTTAPFSITCQWNTTGLSGDYTFTITALNKSGNTKSCTAIYQQGTGPWLKTTSGDVHSNTKINAPNGP